MPLLLHTTLCVFCDTYTHTHIQSYKVLFLTFVTSQLWYYGTNERPWSVSIYFLTKNPPETLQRAWLNLKLLYKCPSYFYTCMSVSEMGTCYFSIQNYFDKYHNDILCVKAIIVIRIKASQALCILPQATSLWMYGRNVIQVRDEDSS